jgi:diguanylate cyclase (GGDEF)-like protein
MDPSTLDRALEAHPYGYIAAPYNANTLLATLQLALQRHADEVELRREHAEKEAWLERRNESLGELAGKLLEESIHDDLTGLYNRRHLDRVLVRELSLARREDRSLGIILLDLDRFKLLNDTFGHSAGDAALRAVADFLRSRLRAHDVVCRYGGEEIVVVLSGARASEASQLAEQLRAGIEQLRIEHEGKPLSKITASFGVSSYPENGSDPAGLLQAADAALYLSKEQGRNRVSRAPAGAAR